jgi:DNA-binding NarL/FixJ family response regulator
MEQSKKKINILIVDDDEMMRIYFRDIFWIHGRNDIYEVVMASSIEEGEKKILDKENKPEIIFLDLMMPVKDGDNSSDGQMRRCLAFIEKVKNDKDLSSKIIIYSGQKEKIIEDAVKRAGADGYLLKGELMPKEIIAFTDKIYEPNNKN